MNPQILFITPLPPPIHGSSIVSQQIHESDAVNETFTCNFVNISTSRRIEEIGKKLPIKLFRFLGSFILLFWKLLTNRYDLCYLAITCHGKGFLKDAPFVLLCKLFGNKVVIHQHNKGMSADADKPLYRWLLKLVYRNARVILLSWRLYPDISEIVKKENVMICPNGIKLVPIEDVTEKGNKNDQEAIHILFLSNLLLEKGVLILLDALRILKDKDYNIVCDFVGAETKEINTSRFDKEVSVRGIDSIVTYHGKKYGKDKQVFWNNSDIFAFPSNNETFGLVNLEAMANKLPIVSTNVGGIPDIVKDGVNGIIVPPSDAQALAEALEKLIINESLRREMGAHGRELLEQNFTQEIFEQNLCDILNKCIHA